MMQQIREAMKIIHTAFVTVERQQMRNALKYGKANGWIAAEARAPQFPWADNDVSFPVLNTPLINEEDFSRLARSTVLNNCFLRSI